MVFSYAPGYVGDSSWQSGDVVLGDIRARSPFRRRVSSVRQARSLVLALLWSTATRDGNYGSIESVGTFQFNDQDYEQG